LSNVSGLPAKAHGESLGGRAAPPRALSLCSGPFATILSRRWVFSGLHELADRPRMRLASGVQPSRLGPARIGEMLLTSWFSPPASCTLVAFLPNTRSAPDPLRPPLQPSCVPPAVPCLQRPVPLRASGQGVHRASANADFTRRHYPRSQCLGSLDITLGGLAASTWLGGARGALLTLGVMLEPFATGASPFFTPGVKRL
jgi:hypothetical protein